jgi:hypothetical protein
MTDQTTGLHTPAHPNTGLLLRQIFDFSEVTRSLFHTAVTSRVSPVPALLVYLMGCGMRVPGATITPGDIPVSLFLTLFSRSGPTPYFPDTSRLDNYGELLLNPESATELKDHISVSGVRPMWVQSDHLSRAFVRGYGTLRKMWVEGAGSSKASQFITCEYGKDDLRGLLSLGTGERVLSDLFVMSFIPLDCDPNQVEVPPPAPDTGDLVQVSEDTMWITMCDRASAVTRSVLTGHTGIAELNRVKLAALGALLHGDTHIDNRMWGWAGMLVEHSRRSKDVARWWINRQYSPPHTDNVAARR